MLVGILHVLNWAITLKSLLRRAPPTGAFIGARKPSDGPPAVFRSPGLSPLLLSAAFPAPTPPTIFGRPREPALPFMFPPPCWLLPPFRLPRPPPPLPFCPLAPIASPPNTFPFWKSCSVSCVKSRPTPAACGSAGIPRPAPWFITPAFPPCCCCCCCWPPFPCACLPRALPPCLMPFWETLSLNLFFLFFEDHHFKKNREKFNDGNFSTISQFSLLPVGHPGHRWVDDPCHLWAAQIPVVLLPDPVQDFSAFECLTIGSSFYSFSRQNWKERSRSIIQRMVRVCV